VSKKIYYILFTVAFGVISVPTVLSILASEPILIDLFDRAFMKTLLIFAICGLESFYIKRTFLKIIGLICTFILFIGIQWWVMHWPFAYAIIAISGALVAIDVIVSGIAEKNKNLFNYLLVFFVVQRLLIILLPPDHFLWWLDVITGCLITIVGPWYIFKKPKQTKTDFS